MTRPYYAPITSSLLVRKGEARPWVSSAEAKMDPAPRTPVYVSAPPPAPRRSEPVPAPQTAASVPVQQSAAVAPQPTMPPQMTPPQITAPQNAAPLPAASIATPQNDDHVRRCTIRLSQNEFERLGIIAVKKEISRQQVLRQAIDFYLEKMRAEYRSSCGCLGGVCRGDC